MLSVSDLTGCATQWSSPTSAYIRMLQSVKLFSIRSGRRCPLYGLIPQRVALAVSSTWVAGYHFFRKMGVEGRHQYQS